MSGQGTPRRAAPWAANSSVPRTGSTDEAPAGSSERAATGPVDGVASVSTHDTSAERTFGVGSDAETVAHGDTAETVAARERPGTASSVLTAVLTGLLVGAVATAMHGNIWYLDGWWLPWGLVFSGALLLSASVWCGTSTERVWAAAVPGLVTYVIAWAGAYLREGSALVVTTWQAPIGVVGILWFVVVFVAVMCSVIVTGRWLVRRRAR
ncbi:hypothetical protein [Kocuria rhizophila]|uniref:hypothetical protein n=1 Tax=Kocuria rhizophila TaxID=72000 RepID=UPI0007503785|nr:hypothetical protein [Kocuria rhizophila]KUP28704.1 hypothetical protein IX41_00105 [Kocuria rhizophila]